MGSDRDTASRPLHLVEDETGVRVSEPGKSVVRSQLVNRLNYLNFQDLTVLVGLRHVSYDNAITLRARPPPAPGSAWTAPGPKPPAWGSCSRTTGSTTSSSPTARNISWSTRKSS